MNKEISERINGWAPVFRLITPTLLAIIGTIMISGNTRIQKEMVGLKAHFLNHLHHHQDLEVGYAERLSKIESDRFTDEDGRRIKNELSEKINKTQEELDHTKRVLRDIELNRMRK